MQVRDVMTASPVACVPEDRVVAAAKIMVDRDCGAVPVVESQHCRHVVGIVTDRDIVKRLVARERNPLDATLMDCMTPNVYAVAPTDDIETVTRLMEKQQIRRVPVVEAGILVGIVATADLARRLEDEELLGEVLEEVSEPVLAAVA